MTFVDRAFRIGRTLDVRFSDSGGSEWFPARTKDLSRTGIFLRAERAPASGAEVSLQLFLPDDRRIDLVGVVAWSRPVPDDLGPSGGFGVRLDDPPADWTDIIDAMEARARSTTPPPLTPKTSAVNALLDELDLVLPS